MRALPLGECARKRFAAGDSRLSLPELYPSRDDYQAKATKVAQQMVKDRLLLPEDLSDPINQAVALYDWATRSNCK